MSDLLLVNGRIHTEDPARPLASSLAARDGRIESLDERPPARRVVDLKGACVVPGFIRTAVHLPAAGRRLLGPEAALDTLILAAQREALPLGVVAVHDLRVGEEELRALRSLEQGRSLRLRVHAVFRHPDPRRLAEFLRETAPRGADGGFEAGGRLSLRAAGMGMESGAAAVEQVGRAALDRGWQFVLEADGPEAVAEARALFQRLGAPPEARWRIESGAVVDRLDPTGETLSALTHLAAASGFMNGGMLAPGRPADLVVLSGEWTGTSRPRVLSTVMDGRVAYQAREVPG